MFQEVAVVVKRQAVLSTDIDYPNTWIKYRASLCQACTGACCSLPVEVRVADLVRMGLIDEFDAAEPAKRLARRLSREGVIDHFNHKHEIFTLARLANDDCIYLDQQSRRCSIYEQRPETCRNHPQVGPRPGFCAYRAKL